MEALVRVQLLWASVTLVRACCWHLTFGSQPLIDLTGAHIPEMVLRDERAAVPIGSYNPKYGVNALHAERARGKAWPQSLNRRCRSRNGKLSSAVRTPSGRLWSGSPSNPSPPEAREGHAIQVQHSDTQSGPRQSNRHHPSLELWPQEK